MLFTCIFVNCHISDYTVSGCMIPADFLLLLCKWSLNEKVFCSVSQFPSNVGMEIYQMMLGCVCWHQYTTLAEIFNLFFVIIQYFLALEIKTPLNGWNYSLWVAVSLLWVTPCNLSQLNTNQSLCTQDDIKLAWNYSAFIFQNLCHTLCNVEV